MAWNKRGTLLAGELPGEQLVENPATGSDVSCQPPCGGCRSVDNAPVLPHDSEVTNMSEVSEVRNGSRFGNDHVLVPRRFTIAADEMPDFYGVGNEI